MVSSMLLDRALLTTTTDSPIVRATAVAAVRVGLNRVASDASRPAVGESRRRGTASARTKGVIRYGAARTMPRNIAIVSPIPAAAPSDELAVESLNQNRP